METNLTIRSTGKFGNRGERYEVLLGEEIIATGSSPEFAACRVLKDHGITGSALFWREREARCSMDLRMGIEWGAMHCVSETVKTGARFAKWAPNPLFGSARQSDEEAGTADDEFPHVEEAA